jgi:hypothetical protein
VRRPSDVAMSWTAIDRQYTPTFRTWLTLCPRRWRDPRYLRSIGPKSGTIPAASKSSKNQSDDEE